MIVIPRKKGESIVIGDDIILTVIEVRGDKVRLGVELPRAAPFTGERCTRRSAEWSRGNTLLRHRPKGSHRRECSRSAEMS